MMESELFPRHKAAISTFGGQIGALYNATISVESGAATLQKAVQDCIVRDRLGNVSTSFSAKQLPAWPQNQLAAIVAFLVALFEGFAFMPLITTGLMHISQEKVSKCREYLFILGLRRWVYWLSWVLTLAVPAAFNIAVLLTAKIGFGLVVTVDIWFLVVYYVLF
jgi:hypothetical protein